jgi:prevent-host-death family protein
MKSLFRRNLGEMLNQVQYRRDSVVINKDGKPAAALMDTRLLSRLRRIQERFDALATRNGDAFSPLPVADGLAEIDRIVSEERALSSGRS